MYLPPLMGLLRSISRALVLAVLGQRERRCTNPQDSFTTANLKNRNRLSSRFFSRRRSRIAASCTTPNH